MPNFRDIPMPPRIARLPRDKHGHPVPKFVAWIDGVPDFRISDGRHFYDGLRFDACWICGLHIGATAAFVLGPMCTITRTAPEPPSHVECADYAARACPFLATPGMRRRETGLPQDLADPAGIMLRRNPGVAVVWITKGWRSYRDRGGWLFHVGEPVETRWYAEGRPATRAEAVASIDSGLPELRAVAAAERQPAKALAALDNQHTAALAHLPADTETSRP
jgi:hypothetical protein